MRLANAILHTYTLDKHKDPELDVPMKRVRELFGKTCNEEALSYVSGLVDEILAEPVAVINKELDRKLIKWKTYVFLTLLAPIKIGADSIKFRINLEYIRIMKEFVINPYIEL